VCHQWTRSETSPPARHLPIQSRLDGKPLSRYSIFESRSEECIAIRQFAKFYGRGFSFEGEKGQAENRGRTPAPLDGARTYHDTFSRDGLLPSNVHIICTLLYNVQRARSRIYSNVYENIMNASYGFVEWVETNEACLLLVRGVSGRFVDRKTTQFFLFYIINERMIRFI
jgi:hypothetical protein